MQVNDLDYRGSVSLACLEFRRDNVYCNKNLEKTFMLAQGRSKSA